MIRLNEKYVCIALCVPRLYYSKLYGAGGDQLKTALGEKTDGRGEMQYPPSATSLRRETNMPIAKNFSEVDYANWLFLFSFQFVFASSFQKHHYGQKESGGICLTKANPDTQIILS